MHGEDPALAEITAYRPWWICWYGKVTGRYWAVPIWRGAPDEMIEAGSLTELDERMTEVENSWPPGPGSAAE